MSTPSPGATLALDQASRADALARGLTVMRLFVRRSAPADQWESELEPYLTPQAAQAYQNVDPASVPASKITGSPTLTPASTPLVARVSVPTDVGSYLVVLARSSDSPTWLADRILPPEGLGGS